MLVYLYQLPGCVLRGLVESHQQLQCCWPVRLTSLGQSLYEVDSDLESDHSALYALVFPCYFPSGFQFRLRNCALASGLYSPNSYKTQNSKYITMINQNRPKRYAKGTS